MAAGRWWWMVLALAVGCTAASGGSGMAPDMGAEDPGPAGGNDEDPEGDGSDGIGGDGDGSGSGSGSMTGNPDEDPTDTPTSDLQPGDLAILPNHVSVGTSHSCARLESGDVYCWGRRANGQMGTGSTEEEGTPYPVRFSADGARQVTTGATHTCVLKEAGSVVCAGGNWEGQLGNGAISMDGEPTPVEVSGLMDATHVSAGGVHTCAVREDGSVMCWGWNESGTLGSGTTSPRSETPVQVQGLADAVMVTTGFSFTCALDSEGDVYCWGSNCGGQLGTGTAAECGRFSSSEEPAPVQAALPEPAIHVDAGDSHACAVTAGGELYCWGRNDYGQVSATEGGVVATPSRVDGLGHVRYVSAGDQHTCAIVAEGDLYCWGTNSNGQLGDGTDESADTPQLVTALMDVVQLDTSGHTCAVSQPEGASPVFYCWGSASQGQIGHGSMGSEPEMTPVRVVDLP